MKNEVNFQCNKLLKLDNTMLMYRIYNAETREKLINTVQEIHNVTSSYERLFVGKHNPTIFRCLYTNALGIQQYAFDSFLFLRVVQDKYISLYKELISQLKSYVSAIRILAKGYLPTTLITPSKLQDILAEVTKSLQQTSPDYALVLDRLHLYYDMQLVTFGIDREMNLVIQFPVFIQPYVQRPLILYQLETVPVPILDTNTEAQSYTHLCVNKTYIALNTETYIMLTQQELRSCKKIGNEFYCEELLVVKHKSTYSCKSAIYFNLTTDIIRKNCNFDFYFNKTDVAPTVLDGGHKIILDNWPIDKHIICNVNNDIPVKIPSHPYVLVNRSMLCYCGIEADSHHLLESLAACDNKPTELTMYFTIDLAFSNYLELMQNMTNQLPINRGKTDFEQTLSIHLNILHFDNSLSNRPGNLKEFTQNYMQSTNNKEIFDLQKKHTRYTSSPCKNFFLNKIVSIFMFTSSIISIITITLVIYLFCKHKHIRTIVASLLLYKVKGVDARTPTKIDDSECGMLGYIGIALTLLSMAIVILLHYRKSKFCRGHRFSNVLKNSIVHLRCTALYTNKTLQNIRKSSLIQNHRHSDIRRYQVEQKLFVGHFRDKLG